MPDNILNLTYLLKEAVLAQFAKKLAVLITQPKEGVIVFLEGPLGVGKTTLVRHLLQAMGYRQKVVSPSYCLVESYRVAGRDCFHFDFYRLDNPSELIAIGVTDYFLSGAICLIEWGEKMRAVLPPPDLICNLRFTTTEERCVQLTVISPQLCVGCSILKAFQGDGR